MRIGPHKAGVWVLLGASVLLSGLMSSCGAPTSRRTIGAGLGEAFVYTCSASHKYSYGDTWYTTWSNDDRLYTTSDDGHGFAGRCDGRGQGFCNRGAGSNVVVNALEGRDPQHLRPSFTNCMEGYGHAIADEGDQENCPDGDTWKTGGILSVDGALYLVVSRQSDSHNQYPSGFQAVEDATIIKSDDHGRRWTSPWNSMPAMNGAAPTCNPVTHHYEAMFPGSRFATVFFINYGQDDAVSSATDGNGGDTYVYAMANDGFAYDGSNEILGRVPRNELRLLDASKWRYYRNNGYSGGSGNDGRNWTTNAGFATPVLSASHELSQASIQYISAARLYLMTSFYYPSFDQCWPAVSKSQNPQCDGRDEARNTQLSFYAASTPWGPWTKVYSASNPGGVGLYDPTLVAKFSSLDGIHQTIFASGDFVRPGSSLYALRTIPFVLTARQPVRGALVP